MSSKLLIASDHAGFELKSFLIKNLTGSGLTIEDLGCAHADIKVDYPDFAAKLCTKLIAEPQETYGILVCGSGIGVAIAANRFNKIRAVNCYDSNSTFLARKHNNANVICFGARLLKPQTALRLLQLFLSTEFEGGRHELRVEKIDHLVK